MRRLRETYPSQPNMQARCVGGKNEKFLSLLIFNIIITGLQGSCAYAYHYQFSILFNIQYYQRSLLVCRAVAPMLTSSRLAPLLRSHRFTKLLIVRHPFGRYSCKLHVPKNIHVYLTFRLVSAFRDKLERFNSYYYTNYGRKIVTRFRRRAEAKFGSEFFSEK